MALNVKATGTCPLLYFVTEFSPSYPPEGATDADGVISGSGVSPEESVGELAGELAGELVGEVAGPLAAASPMQIQVSIY